MTAQFHPQRPESSSWIIRTATTDDVSAINELFAKVFGRRRDDAATRWRLFENPAGHPVVVVAEDGGRIVAHRALWPVAVNIGPSRVLGAQSIDLMVDAAYRGRGVFREVSLAAFAEAERRGFELLYGFPNGEAIRASAHLGWNHVGGVPKFVRPLRSDAFRRLPTSLRPIAAAALRVWPRARCGAFSLSVERPSDAELTALLHERPNATNDICEAVRSPSWYDWRFSPRGEGHYQWLCLRGDGAPAAFAVWGHSQDGHDAWLAEVVGVSRQATSSAVACVIGRAREAGCSKLSALTTREDVLHALAVNGFRDDGTATFRVKVGGAAYLQLARSFASWQLQGCDFDVY